MTDTRTSAPVVGATVNLQGKAGTTSATGHFVLQGLVLGTAPLTIMHPQYVTLEQPFELKTAFQLSEFKLEPK